MSLTRGTRLGPFEVLTPLGAGGMGEVYRATDTNLAREVAIKVLPDEVAADRERLARFDREARMLAALSHPNIAAIFGMERSGGINALVMELVEGPTLAERLRRGALPVEEAIAIGQQITDALEAAHEKGIVHRDLKPANIKVTPAGDVKVLDFGLAKMRENLDANSTPEPPTVTTSGTVAGLLLGTAPYMSPEQARGHRVDRRTDIWAFGCVLYEMLTARVAFAGDTVSDTLAAVLGREPDWSRLPDHTPAAIRRLLRRCLEKDVKYRLHDVADVRLELREGLASPLEMRPVVATRSRTALLMAAGIALLAALLGAIGAWNLKPSEPRPISRFSYVLGADQPFHALGRPLLAIAPDGASLVYAAGKALYRRMLSDSDAAPIRGTEGSPTTPFISPDGQSVGYWDAATRELRRISIGGGTPVLLVSSSGVYGATWNGDDRVLYAQEDGIWRVSANGGAPEHVVRIENGELAYGPRLLPNEDAVLFSLVKRGSMSGQAAAWDQAQVVVQSLQTGERTLVIRGGDARILPTGHLIYALDTVLFAIPFDVARRKVSGAPVPMITGVQRMVRGSTGQGGGANYDISQQGTLAYVPAVVPFPDDAKLRLLTVGLDGQALPLLDEQRPYWRPRISPDGTRVAVEVFERGITQIWIVDLERRTASPLTRDGENGYAVWTSDGKFLIYRSNREGTRGIYLQPADGSALPQLLLPTDGTPTDVSPNGTVAFYDGRPQDIRTFTLDGKSASDFLVTPAVEHMAAFSPDGAWVAYASNESGQDEVYVRPYPRTAGVAKLVSIGGGTGPVWARDGSALYYRGASGDLMAVATTLRPTFTAGRPGPLFRFDGSFRPSGTAAAYDVHPDGRRFIMVSTDDRTITPSARIDVVLNWDEELKRAVPKR